MEVSPKINFLSNTSQCESSFFGFFSVCDRMVLSMLGWSLISIRSERQSEWWVLCKETCVKCLSSWMLTVTGIQYWKTSIVEVYSKVQMIEVERVVFCDSAALSVQNGFLYRLEQIWVGKMYFAKRKDSNSSFCFQFCMCASVGLFASCVSWPHSFDQCIFLVAVCKTIRSQVCWVQQKWFCSGPNVVIGVRGVWRQERGRVRIVWNQSTNDVFLISRTRSLNTSTVEVSPKLDFCSNTSEWESTVYQSWTGLSHIITNSRYKWQF